MDSGDENAPFFDESHEDHEDAEDGKFSAVLCGCCCCCILVYLAVSIGLSFTLPSCGDTASANYMHWNAIIPPVTDSQLASWRFAYQEAEIFSNETKIGGWTRHKVIMFTSASYAYTSAVGGQEHVLLQGAQTAAWKRIFQGKQYTISQCDESLESYTISEDLSERSWFEWGEKTRVFDIQNKEGQQVARSEHLKSDLFTLGGAHWSVVVKSPTGEILASLDQESFGESEWFKKQAIRAQTLRPDIIPTEVISFLGAVFDLDGQADSDESSGNR